MQSERQRKSTFAVRDDKVRDGHDELPMDAKISWHGVAICIPQASRRLAKEEKATNWQTSCFSSRSVACNAKNCVVLKFREVCVQLICEEKKVV